MTLRYVLPALALLAACTATAAAQTEIPGTVTAVDGHGVVIAVSGEMLPRVGDPVRIRFRDPVPGVGLVYLDGGWRVSEVRRDEVDATPRGDTGQPQIGMVALITSPAPQSKAEFEAAQEPDQPERPAAEPLEEEPVAAYVREREDEPLVDRRHWVYVDWGMDLFGVQEPFHRDWESDQPFWGAMHAALGVFVLPTLVVNGAATATNIPATAPPHDESENVAALIKTLGATFYFGNPGIVPGDLHPFVQAGLAWYDIYRDDLQGEMETTGTGNYVGAGLVWTRHLRLGLYVAAQLHTAEFDESYPVFDLSSPRVSVGFVGFIP